MWRGSFKKNQPGTSTLIGNDHIDKIMSNNVYIWLNFDVWLICLKINLFWGGGYKSKMLAFLYLLVCYEQDWDVFGDFKTKKLS